MLKIGRSFQLGHEPGSALVVPQVSTGSKPASLKHRDRAVDSNAQKSYECMRDKFTMAHLSNFSSLIWLKTTTYCMGPKMFEIDELQKNSISLNVYHSPIKK